MAEEPLQQRIETNPLDSNYFELSKQTNNETIEVHYVKGKHEKWLVEKSRDMQYDTSYWCYIRTIE